MGKICGCQAEAGKSGRMTVGHAGVSLRSLASGTGSPSSRGAKAKAKAGAQRKGFGGEPCCNMCCEIMSDVLITIFQKKHITNLSLA